jgi:hypothetical protein
MFDPTSRYSPLETAKFKTPDGREIAYKRRRFLPQGKSLPLLTETLVASGDRTDLLAAKMLGDSLQFWRIADANNCMHPQALVDEPGATVRIPVPQPLA